MGTVVVRKSSLSPGYIMQSHGFANWYKGWGETAWLWCGPEDGFMLWCRGCGEGWGQEPDGQKLATGAPVWAESALPLQWGLLWVLPGQKAVTGSSGGSEGAAMKYKSRFPDCSHDRRPGLPRATQEWLQGWLPDWEASSGVHTAQWHSLTMCLVKRRDLS